MHHDGNRPSMPQPKSRMSPSEAQRPQEKSPFHPPLAKGERGGFSRLHIIEATMVVLLSGCMLGPDYRRPTWTAPDVFRGAPSATVPDAQFIADLKWFEVF